MTEAIPVDGGYDLSQLYEDLFDDGRITEEEARCDSSEVPLSALARYTKHMRGKITKEELRMRERVGQDVASVLGAWERGELVGLPNLVSNGTGTESLSEATAEVINRWERACLRNDQVSPFEDLPVEGVSPEEGEREFAGLIVMTAT